MRPNRIGQVAKFHSPLPDENPDQLYIVLEIIEDDERPRANIKALNTGLSYPPVNTVSIDELEIVEVDTTGLEGHKVTINKTDYSQATGKVVKAGEQNTMPELTKGVKGIETNVWLTILDENEKEHTGTLLVN